MQKCLGRECDTYIKEQTFAEISWGLTWSLAMSSSVDGRHHLKCFALQLEPVGLQKPALQDWKSMNGCFGSVMRPWKCKGVHSLYSLSWSMGTHPCLICLGSPPIKRYGSRLLPVVPSARTRGDGHKLEHRRFPLNTNKHFCVVQVPEHWHRLPWESVESPTWRSAETTWIWSWVPCTSRHWTSSTALITTLEVGTMFSTVFCIILE